MNNHRRIVFFITFICYQLLFFQNVVWTTDPPPLCNCNHNFTLTANPGVIIFCLGMESVITATGTNCSCAFSIVNQPGGWELADIQGNPCSKKLKPQAGGNPEPGCIQIKVVDTSDNGTVCEKSITIKAIEISCTSSGVLPNVTIERRKYHTEVCTVKPPYPVAWAFGGAGPQLAQQPQTEVIGTSCDGELIIRFLIQGWGPYGSKSVLKIKVNGQDCETIIYETIPRQNSGSECDNCPPRYNPSTDNSPESRGNCVAKQDKGNCAETIWLLQDIPENEDGTTNHLRVGIERTDRDEEFNHFLLKTRPQVVTDDNSASRELFGVLHAQLSYLGEGRIRLYWFNQEITNSALGGWSTPEPISVGWHAVSDDQNCEIHDWHWIYEHFTVVGTQESSENGDVHVTFTLDPTQGTQSIEHIAQITVDSCEDVELIPDLETHNDFNSLSILPGDEEFIDYKLNYVPPEGIQEIWFRIVNDNIARIKHQEDVYVRDIQAQDFLGRFEIHGRQEGSTGIQVWYGHPDDPESVFCKELPILVGGTLEIAYSTPPTFRSGEDPGIIVAAIVDGGGGGAQPESSDPATIPIVNRPNPTPLFDPALIQALDGKQDSIITLRLRDAQGRPKPARIFLKVDNDVLRVVQQPGRFDRSGYAEVTIQGSDQIDDIGYSIGAKRAQILFLLGRSVDRSEDQEVLDELGWVIDIENFPSTTHGQLAIDYGADVGGPFTPHFKYNHYNTLHSVYYQDLHFENDLSTKLRTGLSINFPVMNHLWYKTLEKWIRGGTEFSYAEQEVLGAFQIDEGVQEYIDRYEFYVESGNAPSWLLEVVDRLRNTGYTSPGIFGQSGGANGGEINWGAMAAEIAWEITKAQIPGWDVIDLFVEYFWRPVIKDESPNNLAGILSLIGLLVDFGHLIPGVGNAGAVGVNLLVGVLRAAVKIIYKIPVGPVLIKLVVTVGGTVVKSIQVVFHYLAKFKKEIGELSGLERATLAIKQWYHCIVKKIIPTPALEFATPISNAVEVIGERASISFANEGAEGLAWVLKRNGGQTEPFIRGLIGTGKYTDDVMDTAVNYCRHITDIDNFSDEAVEGVAVAVKAKGVGNASDVEGFIKGTAVTTTHANKAFSNIKAIDGTEGIGDMATYLKRNANNLKGIDGAIYETTVARKIMEGSQEVGGSGSLLRVSNDGVEGFDKIDTVTGNWAIQIKHKRTGTPDESFNAGDLTNEGTIDAAEDYLAALKAQADDMQKLPVLITNRSLSGPLNDLLHDYGIVHLKVAD